MEQISRLRYSPREAAKLLGISKAKLYEHINSGAIRSHLVDGRRWIRDVDLRDFITDCEMRAAKIAAGGTL